MLLCLLGLLASAEEPPVQRLPSYRQVELRLAPGIRHEVDRPGFHETLGLAFGLRPWRRYGIELRGDVSRWSGLLTPMATLRPITGRLEPVLGLGGGLGLVDERPVHTCDPEVSTVGCEWTDLLPQEEERLTELVIGRLSAGLRMEHRWAVVQPEVDVQLWLADGSDLRTQIGVRLTVGWASTKTEAPAWAVDLAEERRTSGEDQSERLALIREDFFLPDERGIAAWHRVLGAYPHSLPGPQREELEEYLVYVLQYGRYSRKEAAARYRLYGSDFEVLRPAFTARPWDCSAAARSVQYIAMRTGREAEGVAFLDSLDRTSCSGQVRTTRRALVD